MNSSRDIAPLLLGTLLLLSACPPPKGNSDPDGGTTQTDGGGQTDGGQTDGGTVEPLGCGSDWLDCAVDEVCNLSTGKCVTGTTCNPSMGYAHCNYKDGQISPGAGCDGAASEEACVCAVGGQVCKKRTGVCEPCGSDEECGDNATLYTKPAKCIDFQGEKVCLQLADSRGCPAGQEPDTTQTYCVPAAGSTCAESFVCTADDQCPATRPICNLATGTCTRGCYFDLKTGASTCSEGKVCHQDGRCAAQCDPNNDTCGEIDPSFSCRLDSGNVHRCRISGCLDDIECDVPASGAYLGFCDLSNNSCVTDRCRPELGEGINPDCRLPNGCDAGGQCYLMDCVERGGNVLSCGANQVCCGQCRNISSNPNRDACDPLVCTGSETPGDGAALPGCVVATNPPWCVPCQNNDGCTSISNPKEAATDANLCMGTASGINMCAPTCESAADCPTQWQCAYISLSCDPADASTCKGSCVDDGSYGQACSVDGDCSSDPNSDVKCVADPADGVKRCHQENFRCKCASDAECPDPAQGITPRCETVGFQKDRCIASKACIPQGDICG